MKRKVVAMYLGNRWASFIGDFPKEKIDPYVSFYPPGYRWSRKFRMRVWNGRISMLRRGKMASGLFRAVREDLEKLEHIQFLIQRVPSKIEFDSYSPRVIKSDRDYQNECINKMVEGARDGGGLILNATGSGKTYIAAMFFSRLCGSAVFLVDELTLMHQARKELASVLGEPIGQVGNQIFEPKRITVATVQTMHRHKDDPRFHKWTQDLKVVVIDEIHVAMNRRNFETVAKIEPPAVYGLTATLELKKKPVRLKAWSLAGPVLYEYPLARGQKEGVLAPSIVVRVLFKNLIGTEKEYWPDYRQRVSENPRRNQLLKELVNESYKRGYHTIVLVEKVDHLQFLSKRFFYIPHRIVYGEKEVEKRVEAQQKFEEGKIRLILANKVFKKGINIKRIDVVIDAAALKSKNDAVQKHGRGLRLCEGKTGLLYFDIADVGMPSEDNRFHKASRSRARALKAAGVFIGKLAYQGQPEGKNWAMWAFDHAEKWLRKETDRINQVKLI